MFKIKIKRKKKNNNNFHKEQYKNGSFLSLRKICGINDDKRYEG